LAIISSRFRPVQATGSETGRWLFRQLRDDPDAGRAWATVCEVDLFESEGVAVVHTVGPDRV
jgi:hypothetical protein